MSNQFKLIHICNSECYIPRILKEISVNTRYVYNPTNLFNPNYNEEIFEGNCMSDSYIEKNKPKETYNGIFTFKST